ncbi:MAG: heparan N-sulfatase [Verrucomicrobiales bacterium]|nr:heparan N-sulfatase [Verrucomicrobiales bacterium]|tara:strand:- start:3805 stop:5391 length:1587 start_codon:yes stop_codon:yes gene_type:complete
MTPKNKITRIITALVMLATVAVLSAADKRPNILFCIADDASFPHMGAYGTSWVKTPGFDRVAEKGILFTRAYTPNAKCSPSRACILTGRNTWQLENACNHVPFFPAKFKSYCEALMDNGYTVGETGKGWAPGVANDKNGKRRLITGIQYESKKTKPPAKHISANDYAGNFRDFLNKKPLSKPWAFWYGSTEPHRAYEYGVGVRLGGKKLSDIDKVPSFWPDTEEVRNDMLDYAFEIEYFDKHLLSMLDLLEERGELDNTMVVVTADNGMPFPRIKGQEYELSNHLPLAIMWPRGIENPGRTVSDYVSFIDFAPTFLELAGLDAKKAGMQPITGRSLTEIFKSTKSGRVVPGRDHVLIGKERHDIGRPYDWGYPIRGIIKNDVLFLRNYESTRWPAGNPETGYLNCDGGATKTVLLNARRNHTDKGGFWQLNFGMRPEEEMYRVNTDRDCVNNLADSAGMKRLKIELEKQMVRELTEQGDPRIQGKGHIFDEYPYAHPATKDFYRRYVSGEKMRTGWVNNSDFEKGPLD